MAAHPASGSADDATDHAAEELQLLCATDRRGAESLFLELRRRARALGLEIELVKAERCAVPSPPDASRQVADP